MILISEGRIEEMRLADELRIPSGHLALPKCKLNNVRIFNSVAELNFILPEFHNQSYIN